MEQLKACYEAYFAQAEKVWKERPVWDGMLGLGSSVKDHPCHREFYDAVQTWVENFVKESPTAETAGEAVTYILQTSEAHKGQFTYWALFAAHGLVQPMIPLLTPQCAAQTLQWYEKLLPRQERMPVHRDVIKLLKKRQRQ